MWVSFGKVFNAWVKFLESRNEYNYLSPETAARALGLSLPS